MPDLARIREPEQEKEVPQMEVVFEVSYGEDAEQSLRLRRIRERLGYGPGWTLWQALWDKVECFVLWMVAIAGVAIFWAFIVLMIRSHALSR